MNILFITFDFHEDNKPVKSVAVATLEGYILDRVGDSQVDSFSFNMNDEYSIIFQQMASLKKKLKMDYDYICVSFYVWNIRYLDNLIKIIKVTSPQSKIVAGGYKVNCMSIERLVTVYDTIDHFIIGYAERSLEMLSIGKDTSRILNYKVNNENIPAIYSTSLIEVNDNNIVRLGTKEDILVNVHFVHVRIMITLI